MRYKVCVDRDLNWDTRPLHVPWLLNHQNRANKFLASTGLLDAKSISGLNS